MERKMFFLSKDKKRVIDDENRVVGSIDGGYFFQYDKSGLRCDTMYSTGLSAIELEQVAELLQRNSIVRN